jgi:hypothetical protein
MPIVVPTNDNRPLEGDPGESNLLMAAANMHERGLLVQPDDPIGRAIWESGQRTVLPSVPGGRAYREAEERPASADEPFKETVKAISKMAPGGIKAETMRKSEEIEDVRQPAEPLLGSPQDAAAHAFLRGEISEKDFRAAEPELADMSKSTLAKALGYESIAEAKAAIEKRFPGPARVPMPRPRPR